ncbi:MAG TPA: antitoxin Xre/MbcA/ParS toxin-binding domain-containing protein [Burkholderiales bacterium]|nr:antitoxin Xre/MbcA/ParS toxin-binding domain-containing protein [Burkholderiales bacterium]
MKAYTSTLEMIGVRLGEKKTRYRVKRASSGTASGPLIELGERTVPFTSIEALSQRIRIDATGLLAVIGMPERTAARRREQGYLKPDEADRLLRVARVVAEATRVFGSEDKAARWLKTAHPVLDEATPFSLLDSDAGVKAVTDELTRIDYGDFA